MATAFQQEFAQHMDTRYFELLPKVVPADRESVIRIRPLFQHSAFTGRTGLAVAYVRDDGGLPDEQAIRYMETMIVRLKSLPHPPAIVILEVATRHGVTLWRHRKVAEHYGLLEVDFQAAVDAHMAPGKNIG